jgi:hypothetical protein
MGQEANHQRLITLTGILGHGSTADSLDKIKAIRELGEARLVSGVAAGMLFNRANIQFEPDPEVREVAAQNLRFVCETRNRLAALRLVRLTSPVNEPEPAVRIGALRSLAVFQTAEAAQGVYDAANPLKEPNPKVRAAAKDLIEKGLASSLF